MAACMRCGEDNPARARFCLGCGTALGEGATERREARKTVTIVFTDIVGSTDLGERLDAESVRAVMDRYFTAAHAVLERHGGTVEKFIGDAVMAVFGIPRLHEDDAVRAVRAAAEMRTGLTAVNDEIERRWGVRIDARTGVNTGEVVVGDPAHGQAFATGDAVNVAARLEQAARPGEVVIGPTTARLVAETFCLEPLEPLELRGKAARVPAYRLVEMPTKAAARVRRFASPLVGRENQLALLEKELERAQADRACRLVTVLGEAGVGKSRLTREFRATLDGRFAVLRGRCLAYGQGITFWPMAEVVKGAAGITDEDSPSTARERVSALMAAERDAGAAVDGIIGALGLLDGTTEPEETFWAFRRLLEALACRRPHVVVFDDIHWAEPTFLDLIEHVVALTRDVSLVVLCLARPELLDDRPEWGSSSACTTTRLQPLTELQVRSQVASMLGDTQLPTGFLTRVTDTAEGNPLFVEELIRMLVDEGRLRRHGDRWRVVGELSSLTMPPTVQAVLAARLDSLAHDERAVIERAAVAGKAFWPDAISSMSSADARDAVPTHLRTLVRREFVRPTRESFGGESGYRFDHILVRNATYEATLKALRRDLHESFADWLERTAGERATEYVELVGYHLEQAYRLAGELNLIGTREQRLAERAGQRLAEGGSRALARGDMPAAVGLLGRAASLVEVDDPRRCELLLELGVALMDAGDLARCESVLSEGSAVAKRLGDRRLAVRIDIEQRYLRLRSDAVSFHGEHVGPLNQAISILTELDDRAGLARALCVLGILDSWIRVRYGDAVRHLQDALRYTQTAVGGGSGAEIVFWLTVALEWGPAPAADMSHQASELLRGAEGHPATEAPLLYLQALSHALLGNADEARRCYTQGRERFDDLGLRAKAAGNTQVSGMVELLLGDPAAAERELRWGYESLTEMGDVNIAATSAALLAEAVMRQGSLEQSERYAELSQASAAEDDLTTHILWRTARAKVLAYRGEAVRGVDLARDAVAIAESTDSFLGLAEAHTALAVTLEAARDHAGADAALARAAAVYKAKGAAEPLDRVRVALGHEVSRRLLRHASLR